jgi:transcriptional regulator with XRE-family HTH domain
MSIYQNEEEFLGMEISPELRDFVEYNLAISNYVHMLLEQKGWTQKELAHALGKTEGEISKWLSGMHNLTLKSIAKMSAILGEKIIYTPDQIAYSKILIQNMQCDFGNNDEEVEMMIEEINVSISYNLN